jgi:hypothetical protein
MWHFPGPDLQRSEAHNGVLAAFALVRGLPSRPERKSYRHTALRVALDAASPMEIDSYAAHAVEPDAGEVLSRAVVRRLLDGSSVLSQASGPFRRSCAHDLRKSGRRASLNEVAHFAGL